MSFIIGNLTHRIWSDWTIENNKFVAMNMIEGSRCGEGRQRSTKVGTLEGGGGSQVMCIKPYLPLLFTFLLPLLLLHICCCIHFLIPFHGYFF